MKIVQNVYAIIDLSLPNIISWTVFYTHQSFRRSSAWLNTMCHISQGLQQNKKVDLILSGVNIDDDIFLQTNTIIAKAVQNFIINTGRFSTQETED